MFNFVGNATNYIRFNATGLEIKTDNLNYYIEIKKGEYFGGGELRDETNKLSSEIGIFYGDKDISLFYNNVEFVGDDYVLKSDSMTYNSQIKEARTFGYTEILSNDSVYVEALGGRFRQTKNRSNVMWKVKKKTKWMYTL